MPGRLVALSLISVLHFLRNSGKLLIQFYMLDRIQNTGFLYVGTTVAKIMKEENLCLEEYLEKYK